MYCVRIPTAGALETDKLSETVQDYVKSGKKTVIIYIDYTVKFSLPTFINRFFHKIAQHILF